jgi:hypothetical protein
MTKRFGFTCSTRIGSGTSFDDEVCVAPRATRSDRRTTIESASAVRIEILPSG